MYLYIYNEAFRSLKINQKTNKTLIKQEVSGNANRHHFPRQPVDNLTTILTNFTNILSIFDLNNLTNNKWVK